jgi:hypothetical protein
MLSLNKVHSIKYERDKHMRIILVLLIGLVSVPTSSHHSANLYFGGGNVTLEGTLTGAKLVNPHAYFRLNLDDGSEWVFETALSWTFLQRRGYTKEFFEVGRRVVISGDSNKDGKKYARISTFSILGDDESSPYTINLSPAARDEWANYIREIGEPCNNLKDCYKLNLEQRNALDLRFSEHTAWVH